MDVNILKKAGLNDSQSKAYIALVMNGEMSALELSQEINESRTNTYAIIDKLIKYGVVAKKNDVNYGAKYIANHPSSLESLAEARRKIATSNEQAVENSMPDMISFYFEHNEQPGINFFQGKAGVEKIYKDQIKEAKPITFWQTREDKNSLGFDHMDKIRSLAPESGINRLAFTPDAPEAPIDVGIDTKKNLLERVWYDPKDYTAPVEWSVYSDKVSIISFGDEMIGMVIQSDQIAESLRQILKITEKGIKSTQGYSQNPKNATLQNTDEFIKKHKNKVPKIF